MKMEGTVDEYEVLDESLFDAGDVYELICDCHGWEFWQDRDGRIYRVYE